MLLGDLKKFQNTFRIARKQCRLTYGRRVKTGYLLRYITSFTSFTVLGTSGKAAATRLGA